MRKMNKCELKIIVPGEVYYDDAGSVEREIQYMLVRELRAKSAELEGEIILSVERDEMRDQITIIASCDAWTDEPETQGPVDMCPTCGQEGFCPCGDEVTPQETEAMVEAIL